MTTSLKINDLALNEELDREAMAHIRGGARRGHSAADMLATPSMSGHIRSRFSKSGAKRRFGKTGP